MGCYPRATVGGAQSHGLRRQPTNQPTNKPTNQPTNNMAEAQTSAMLLVGILKCYRSCTAFLAGALATAFLAVAFFTVAFFFPVHFFFPSGQLAADFFLA